MKLYRMLNVKFGFEFFVTTSIVPPECLLVDEHEIACEPLTPDEARAIIDANKSETRDARIAELQREIDKLRGE